MKKALLFLILLCVSIVGQAQFQTAAQQLIEQSMSGSMFIVSQPYQLKDTVTGDVYGRNNQKHFGIAYSIALKVDGGYYVSSNLFTPWVGDENYKKYEGKLKPVLLETSSRSITDTIWETIPDECLVVNDAQAPYSFVNDTVSFDNKGLPIDTVNSKTTGWLVIVTKKKSIGLDNINKVENLIYKNEIDFTDEKPMAKVTEMENDFILGFFIEPKQTAYGQLTFFLKGLIYKENNGWFIQKMALISNLSQSDEQLNELTPATNDKKNNIKKRKHGKNHNDTKK